MIGKWASACVNKSLYVERETVRETESIIDLIYIEP